MVTGFICFYVSAAANDFLFYKQKVQFISQQECQFNSYTHTRTPHQSPLIARKKKNERIEYIAKQKLQGRPLIKRCMTKAKTCTRLLTHKFTGPQKHENILNENDTVQAKLTLKY